MSSRRSIRPPSGSGCQGNVPFLAFRNLIKELRLRQVADFVSFLRGKISGRRFELAPPARAAVCYLRRYIDPALENLAVISRPLEREPKRRQEKSNRALNTKSRPCQQATVYPLKMASTKVDKEDGKRTSLMCSSMKSAMRISFCDQPAATSSAAQLNGHRPQPRHGLKRHMN